MTLVNALLLGVVQGLAEFLPVSSSGHLVLAQKLLGFTSPPVFFDVALHIGTLLAVLVFFFPRVSHIFADFTTDLKKRDLNGRGFKFVLLLALASVPAFVVGLAVSFFIETIFNSYAVLGFGFFVTSVLLFLSKVKFDFAPQVGDMHIGDALLVGLFQSAAVLPGISRSGSTIVGGLLRGLDREQAFEFSFLLSIPVVIGAGVLELFKGASEFHLLFFSAGMVVSGVVGWFALRLLRSAVINEKLYYFGFYCFALAVVCFGYVLAEVV